MTKQESANEVADALMESSLKWEGVNWKEATWYLALGSVTLEKTQAREQARTDRSGPHGSRQ